MSAKPKAPVRDNPSNTVKPPDEWTRGDKTMTGAQASSLKTLCDEAGEEFNPSLTKAIHQSAVDELQARAGQVNFTEQICDEQQDR